MSLYTMFFIVVTILVLLVLGLVFFFVMKMDRKIDKKDRLGNKEEKKSG